MMMQTKKPAANPLMEIAERIREMREIVGYTEAEMAEKTEVSVEQYHSYEQGTVDFPFTFMHKCALAFGVELTDLLEGQSAKLSSYTVTRRGMGPVTASEDGITIQNMAAMFRQKLATPYWVTYQYSKELQSQPIHTTTHAGQEFDLVVKGTLRVRVGEHEEVLHEGDSIFYKSSTPHGMIAVDGQDCVFLAMIMASSEKEQDLSVPDADARGDAGAAAALRPVRPRRGKGRRLVGAAGVPQRGQIQFCIRHRGRPRAARAGQARDGACRKRHDEPGGSRSRT